MGWLYKPVSKGVLASCTCQPECRPETLLFRKPGLALKVPVLGLPSPQQWCGQSRAGLPRPAPDTSLLLMQLKIPCVRLAAAPTVDSY